MSRQRNKLRLAGGGFDSQQNRVEELRVRTWHMPFEQHIYANSNLTRIIFTMPLEASQGSIFCHESS